MLRVFAQQTTNFLGLLHVGHPLPRTGTLGELSPKVCKY